jgi:hypothetical protein
MTTHLTELELLAIVERAPAGNGEAAILPHEAAHLDACAPCRNTLGELREALDLAASVEMPEPSPLFWDHFSARVRSSVNEVDANGGWRAWILGAPLKVATAAAVVVLIAIGGFVWRVGGPPRATERPDTILGTAASDAHDSSAYPTDDFDADADGEWALVRAVADDASLDDTVAAGGFAAPGSVDNAALALTPAERGELARILREETQAGPAGSKSGA